MKLKYLNAGAGNVRKWELETMLKRPHSEPTFRITSLNKEIADLETEAVAKGLIATTSKPAATPAPVATPAAKQYLADFIDKAKPIIEPIKEQLTGAALVRAAIRADIEKQRVKFELPVRQMSAPATDTGRPSRQQLNAVYVAVKDEPLPANLSDAEAFVQTEKACYQAHLRVGGMRSDAELSETYFRTDRPKGLGLAIMAMKRDRIEKILSTTK